MANIQTFNGVIDENVPWNTGDQSTNNLPPSGNSIRNMLQKRIKKPVTVKYDGKNYRFFSCEDNYQLWLQYYQDPDGYPQYKDLCLAELIAPNPYSIGIYSGNGDDEVPFPTGLRYASLASNDGSAIIKFAWKLLKDGSDAGTGNFIIQLSVTDSKEATVTNTYKYDLQHCELNLYSMLKRGRNKIKIIITENTFKVSAERTFNIECIDLTISTKFDFYNYFNTSNSSTAYLLINNVSTTSQKITIVPYLDKRYVRKICEQQTTNPNTNKNLTFKFPVSTNEYSYGEHDLRIIAYASDPEDADSKKFYSNMLLFSILNCKDDDTYSQSAVLISTSLTNIEENKITSDLVLTAKQYVPFSLKWAYTYNTGVDTQVSWYLYKDEDDISPTLISSIFAKKNEEYLLSYTPIESGDYILKCKYSNNGVEVVKEYDFKISASSLNISEVSGYDLKLSPIGKTNEIDNTDYKYGGTEYNPDYIGTFNNFSWDASCGWNNDTLVINNNASLVFNYGLFEKYANKTVADVGRTFEIDFKSINVDDSSKEICIVGNKNNGYYIKITPNSAGVYSYNTVTKIETEIVSTRFIEGERIKLAFIFNHNGDTLSSAYKNLVMIVNNGIFERVTQLSAEAFNNIQQGIGKITLGKYSDDYFAGSSIVIYSMRCYRFSISIDDEFNNYCLDSTDPTSIIQNNMITTLTDDGESIDYNKVSAKIRTFLLKGNVGSLLIAQGDEAKKNIHCDCIYKDPTNIDGSNDFTVKNCRLRKHGQSNLNVPVPSFKIWTNSEFKDDNDKQTYKAQAYDANGQAIYKGRMSIRKGATRTNKFVLQSNYADSSGTHNGGLLRMMNRTWFDAKIDGEYKLRQAAQVYAYGINDTESSEWKKKMNVDFPKIEESIGQTTIKSPIIRNAPDSVPCCVFYQSPPDSNGNEQPIVFLGQYVWMDDKKADFLYGERSIYKVQNDPFVLNEYPKESKPDTNDNRLWNNNKVIRMEVLGLNNSFVSYLSTTNTENEDFDLEISNGVYRFESDFELIYPDKDDYLEDKKGLENGLRKFRAKVAPFIQWFKNLVATRDSFLSNGGRLDNTLHCHVTQNNIEPNDDNAWSAFREWALHGGVDVETDATTGRLISATPNNKPALDLYKMAAYYIFALRAGGVDSMERNAQIFTDDSSTFYYTPWDWDVIYGKKNTGKFQFNPPITRYTSASVNTTEGADELDRSGFAMSGKSQTTSNWLWDALEAWPMWANEIVPQVAQALYEAGYDYNTLMTMHDDEYANKWCEKIYNKSTSYKYVERGKGYHDYQNGAAKSLRHWWCSISMDYYDAKWKCGEFGNKMIYLRITHTKKDGDGIGIIPSMDTYIACKYGEQGTSQEYGFTKVYKNQYTKIPLIDKQTIDTKATHIILNARYIKSLDLTDLTDDEFNEVQLNGCFTVLTSDEIAQGQIPNAENLKEIIIGRTINQLCNDSAIVGGDQNITSFGSEGTSEYSITINKFWMNGLTKDSCLSFVKTVDGLKDFRAVGATIRSFDGCKTPTKYDVLQLPDTISSIFFNNDSWTENNWSISETNPDNSTGFTFWHVTENKNNGEFVNRTIQKLNHIPESLSSFTIYCNETNQINAINFIKSWIKYLKTIDDENHTAFKTRTLLFSNLKLTASLGIEFTYDELECLANFNNANNNQLNNNNYKGYIMLSSSEKLDDVKLQNIIEWFGADVFIKGKNFVVDYGASAIVLSINSTTAGNVVKSTEEGIDYEIKEGITNAGVPFTYSLNATSFTLGEDDFRYKWQFVINDTPQTFNTYLDCEIVPINDSWFLRVPGMTPESNENTIELQCVNLDNPDETTNYKRLKIKVKRKAIITNIDITTQPETININGSLVMEQLSSMSLIPTYIYNDSTYGKLAIQQEIWEVVGDKPSALVTAQDGSKFNLSYQLPIGVDTLINITARLTVIYITGKAAPVKIVPITIANDQLILDSNSNNALYNVFMKQGYTTKNGKYTIFSLKAIENLIINNNSTDLLNVTTFDSNVNGTNYHVIDYINPEEIDVSILDNLGNDSWNLDTNKSNLKRLNTENTDVNITSNESGSNKLTNIKLGKPTNIDIQNVTKLTSFTIQDTSNIESFIYKNNNSLVNATEESNNTNTGIFRTLCNIIASQPDED